MRPTVSAFAATPEGVDLIFRGGPIIPMAGSSRAVEALAVKNGRIAAVGAADAVVGLKSASTEIVDLDGRALLPGFIDPHQHTVTGALVNALFTDCGYTKYKSRDSLLAMFRDRAAKTPAGQWLLFTSFDNLLQGGDLMMADLDAVSRDHPILVYYINMHTAAGNAAAFAAAGIPANVGNLAGGGHFGRNASGKLNGMIYEESALKKFAIAIPKITPQLAGKALADWLKINASCGGNKLRVPRGEPFSRVARHFALTCWRLCRWRGRRIVNRSHALRRARARPSARRADIAPAMTWPVPVRGRRAAANRGRAAARGR